MNEPSYLELYRRGVLQERLEKAQGILERCELCPRKCGVNRVRGEEGFCRTGRKARVASFNAHFGEEAPLVGAYGSGTIFISSCNLLCSFCQNYDISHGNDGVDLDPGQIAAMMIHLAERGCHNINFVTPTHVVPQLLEALMLAVERGLRVPLVYNSSGYDGVETLKLLENVVDIYMPDFKFWDGKWAQRYCEAPDYREAAMAAIREMHRQVGDLVIDEEGIARRGLLIRHLVMPDGVAGTEEVMGFLAKTISSNTYVNVMDQYRPCGRVHHDEHIGRRLTTQEFRYAMDSARKAGLKRMDLRDHIQVVFAP